MTQAPPGSDAGIVDVPWALTDEHRAWLLSGRDESVSRAPATALVLSRAPLGSAPARGLTRVWIGRLM